IQPVKYLTHQAHRCVIMYDRDEIIAARKKAGLAVNLGETGASEQAVPAIVANRGSAPASGKTISEQPATPAIKPPETDQAVADLDLSNTAPTGTPLREVLAQAAEGPKQFKKWTPASHGISVSISPQTREMNFGRLKVALIAVRNKQRDRAITLLPDHPDIAIESRDNKGKVIQLTPIKKLGCES